MADNIERDEWKPFYVSGEMTFPAIPSSGDPVRFGAMTGIALTDEGQEIALQTTAYFGPFWADVPVHASNGAVAIDDAIYFSDTATGSPATNLSNSPTGVFFGYARAAATSTEVATISINHPASGGGGSGLGGGGYRSIASDEAVTISDSDGVILLAASASGAKAATMTGTFAGHKIMVRLVARSGGSYTFAVTGGDVTFDLANEAATLVYSGAAWELVALHGATLV